MTTQFTDRVDAGRQLAARLLGLREADPVVLALPRGGVPIGFEIAQALGAPLDLILVRKIGAPFEEELAVGAIADGDHPDLVTDAGLLASLNVSPGYLEKAKSDALQELERRRHVYLGNRRPIDIAGRTVIVVDDGIATGSTMLAALRSVRHRKPARIVLAIPVAPQHTLKRLRGEADKIVCLDQPVGFFGISQFYRQFPQLRDEEVIALLDRANPAASSRKPAGSDT